MIIRTAFTVGRKLRRHGVAIIAGAVLLAAPALPAEEIRALLVTGGCCHDYTSQTQLLTEGLGDRLPIAWTVVHGPSSRDDMIALYADPAWADGYDVVVHNECYGGVTDVAYVERIAQAHFAGTPAVMIHCAIHSYRNAATDEWRKCLGVSSYRHESHHPIDPVAVAADHPILADFSDPWHIVNGELYIIERVWPETVPIMKAYGTDTAQDHVVAWTNQYGAGRVFGTTLGHHNLTVADDTFLNLVARGLLWACGRLDGAVPFARGHVNGDGTLDISDAVCLLLYLFERDPSEPCAERVPRCLDAADANDDGGVDIADAVAILQHLFAGAAPLPPPYPECGYDDTLDEVPCNVFEPCR
jgi:type 1 glutamine amidotransferase